MGQNYYFRFNEFKEQKFTASQCVLPPQCSSVRDPCPICFVAFGHLSVERRDLSRHAREFHLHLGLRESIPEADLKTLLKTQQLAPYAKSAQLVTKKRLRKSKTLWEGFR